MDLSCRPLLLSINLRQLTHQLAHCSPINFSIPYLEQLDLLIIRDDLK